MDAPKFRGLQRPLGVPSIASVIGARWAGRREEPGDCVACSAVRLAIILTRVLDAQSIAVSCGATT